MSTARSTPAWSRCSRKALGDLQNSMIWPKFDRFLFISSSAWGLNISMGWMWMWQSVIKSVIRQFGVLPVTTEIDSEPYCYRLILTHRRCKFPVFGDVSGDLVGRERITSFCHANITNPAFSVH